MNKDELRKMLNETRTVIIDYYGSHRESNGWCVTEKSKLDSSEEFNGNLIDAFKKVEKLNERLRYCNGCWYEFRDKEIEVLYRQWSKGLSQSEWYDVVGMTCANTD